MGRRNSSRRRRYNPSHVRTVVTSSMMLICVIVLCLIVGKNIKLNRADDAGPDATPPAASSESPDPGVVPTDESGQPAETQTPEPTPAPAPSDGDVILPPEAYE